MGAVIVVVEHDRGAAPDLALQGLTAARAIAEDLGSELHAVVMGNGSADVLSTVGEYGASRVYQLSSPQLGDYNPEAWGQACAELVEVEKPSVLVAAGTDRGNELLAQVAARLDLPFVANSLSIAADVGSLTREQWGGALHEEVLLDAPVKVLSIALHTVEASTSQVSPTIVDFPVSIDEKLVRSVIRSRVEAAAGVTLATAPVVVGGGRGVGSAEAFAPLEELAAELAGKVGCSRAVTNNGWRPHSDQVGQTGTRIAPTLYIAAGISGATQHWVGAAGAKNVLAINTDPEANMVAKAGWAVIADLHELIPAITQEVQKRRGGERAPN